MSEPRKYQMTREKYDELIEELDHKENVEKPALAKRLKAAIAMGDLKENAEYHDAKETQGFLEGRINELKEMISGAVIVEDFKTYTVVEKGTDFEETYKLVGKTEADPAAGKVSFDSPLGSALKRAEVGDEITVQAPAGNIVFVVTEIS